ncbi:MAG: NADH-quinone oxidoreductase subunit M, partial [Methylophaga sp.]|nr:NADH-quinone oxidoreductase subunit M [Methylophaga sp.]
MFDLLMLSLLIWLPILGGIAVLLCRDNVYAARWLALLISSVTMLLSFGLYIGFDVSMAQMQFVERLPWVDTFNIEYFLGIDGFSMPLMILTTISTLLVVIASWQVIKDRIAQYLAAFL